MTTGRRGPFPDRVSAGRAAGLVSATILAKVCSVSGYRKQHHRVPSRMNAAGIEAGGVP